MINQEQVEKAIYFLRDSASDYGRWVGRARTLKELIKTKEAQMYLLSEGKNIDERKAKARSSEEYLQILEEYEEAEVQATVLGSQRDAAKTLVSAYQTFVRAEQLPGF